MLRPRCICRDERQIDIGLRHAGELDLRLLHRLYEALCAHLVLREVDAVLLFEFLDHPVHDLLIEIIAAEHGVAVRRLDFENTFTEFEDRDVECTAAEVEYEDGLVLIFIETVRERRCCRLIDDAQHLESRNLPRVLRRLTLTVVKIRRDSNHCLRNRLAKIRLCIALELLQDHRRDLGRRVVLAVNRDVIVRIAHMAFDRRDRAIRVRDRLILCEAADETLPVLRKAYDGRRNAAPLGVRDNNGLSALHDRDNGVRRAKINTYYFSHFIFLQNLFDVIF